MTRVCFDAMSPRCGYVSFFAGFVSQHLVKLQRNRAQTVVAATTSSSPEAGAIAQAVRDHSGASATCAVIDRALARRKTRRPCRSGAHRLGDPRVGMANKPTKRRSKRMLMADKSEKTKARLPRGFTDRSAGRDPRRREDDGEDQGGLRTLRLRAGRPAADRIHRRAGKISARPGSAERGRLLLPG